MKHTYEELIELDRQDLESVIRHSLSEGDLSLITYIYSTSELLNKIYFEYSLLQSLFKNEHPKKNQLINDFIQFHEGYIKNHINENVSATSFNNFGLAHASYFSCAVFTNQKHLIPRFLALQQDVKKSVTEGTLMAVKYSAPDCLDYFLSLEKPNNIPKKLALIYKEMVDFIKSGFSGTQILTFITSHPQFEKALPHIELMRKPFLDTFSNAQSSLIINILENTHLKNIIETKFDLYTFFEFLVKDQTSLFNDPDIYGSKGLTEPFKHFLNTFTLDQIGSADKVQKLLNKKENKEVKLLLDKYILKEELENTLSISTENIKKMKV